MLKSLKRITYFVEDVEKAKQWYNTVLDSRPVFDSPFAVIYNIGNCSLSLARETNPLTKPREGMDVYWEVDDIDAACDTFIKNGAHVRTPVKQVLNIRIAQLVDPFGNIIGLTGGLSDTADRTVEKKPSETALTVAFCRALASREKREEIRGPDHLAELFLDDDSKRVLKNDDSIRWTIQNLVTSPLYGYFISRTAFLDSVFLRACKENIPQIVLLGAGYDTRAYRFADQLKDTRVFELDISTTQQNKIKTLKDNKTNIPGNIVFVPINFKTDPIHDALFTAGYDRTGKTLFIWEGVTYYLTKEAVEKTLGFFQVNSGEGSSICFDYMTDKLESINPSEPFQFWIKRNELEDLLSQYGITITEHIDPMEMARRYLTLRDGTIAEKIIPSFCLVSAIVNARPR